MYRNFLNKRIRNRPQSPTLLMSEHTQALEDQGKTVYKLGFGQSPFPVPRVVVQALRDNAKQARYLPVRGLPELREAVAKYNERFLNIPSKAEDILIGPGSKELMCFLQLVYEAELVLPSPSWVSYAPQATILGRKVRWLNTHAKSGWKIDPKRLEIFCRRTVRTPKTLVLNYPCNPTGTTYSADELRNLAKVARKYRLLVLSDEIYSGLNFKGNHVSIASFYPEGTIISNGLSKWCSAGGWRLGTMTFPPNLRWMLQAVAAVASETFSCVSGPVQWAGVRAFQGGPTIDTYVSKCSEVLKVLGTTIAERLQSAHVEVVLPQGGFYLMPNFSHFKGKLRRKKITTSIDFCESLLDETGVALLSASHFGRPKTELSTRLSYVDFDGKAALDAANRTKKPIDEAFVKTHCKKVLTATNKLCRWLNA